MKGSPEVVEYEGRRYMLVGGVVRLDWRNADWKGGKIALFHRRGCKFCGTADLKAQHQPDTCYLCPQTAHLIGPDGRPVHKSCFEADLTKRIMKAGTP